MNDFSVTHPAKGIARFFFASVSAAAAHLAVNAALAPLNPFKGSADAVFFRLFFGSSILIGNAMVFLIRNSRYHGLKLFALTLAAYIGVAQLLGHAEMIAFNFMFGFTAGQIIFLVLSQAATALVFVPLALAVAGKWKAPTEPVEDRTGPFPTLKRKSFLIRLLVLAALWYFCYMIAGYFIADPITHGYYLAKNPNLNDINVWLPILQFFRGIAWTLLVILGVKIMNRPLCESGVLIGLIYGVFHAAGLLLPSAFMPAEMRLSHLPEIILSLVMFAGLAVQTMSYTRSYNTYHHPQPDR